MDGGQLDGNFITYGLCFLPAGCELHALLFRLRVPLSCLGLPDVSLVCKPACVPGCVCYVWLCWAGRSICEPWRQ